MKRFNIDPLHKTLEFMSMNRFIKYTLLASIGLFSAQTLFAQEDDKPLRLSVGAGFENDSNLTVDSIDSNSNVGDTAFVFDASAGYDFLDTDDFGLSAGYDFYQSVHSELDQFDMAIHGFNIDGRYTVGRFDLGNTYMFSNIRLGGDAFMDMHMVRPNVGYLLDNNLVYLIGAYEYQKQNFKSDALVGRDANRHTFSGKSIFLLGEGRTATAGYEWTDHNSLDPGFSFNGHTLDFSLKLPFEIVDREATFRTGYRFQSRNFLEASQSYNNGLTRVDKRHNVSASIEVPIVNNFFGKAEIEYIRSDSNFEVVDFGETITTVSVGWEY